MNIQTPLAALHRPKPWTLFRERDYSGCDLCGHTTFLPGVNTDLFNSKLPTVVCRECSLVQTRPRMTAEAYTYLYEHCYRSIYLNEAEAAVAPGYDLSELEIGRHRVGRYRPWMTDDMRLLEVGAGFGYFSHAVASAFPNAQVLAVDPDPKAIARARELWDLPTRVGWIDDRLGDGSSDVVALFHVLEHVTDLLGTLTLLRNALVDNGRLLVETPNVAGPWSGIGMFHPAHVRHFSPATLRAALEASGFSVESLDVWDDGPSPVSLSVVARRSDAVCHSHVVGDDASARSADIQRRCRSAPVTIMRKRALDVPRRALGTAKSASILRAFRRRP